MRVLMVKKRFASGETCGKCIQAEELLKRRGLWQHIAEVVWADERDASSPGMLLAREYGVDVAPFFLMESNGERKIFTSVLKLIGELPPPDAGAPVPGALGGATSEAVVDVDALAREAAGKAPQAIVARALEKFGDDCVIAFSGAEDVALIDMAVRTGRPFHVVTLDTARLHAETYRFLEQVRNHYGIQIEITFPDLVAIENLVKNKGFFSFYTDGHGECCGIRKVAPLKRALARHRAWMTGQRRDQSPTRTDVPVVGLDVHAGRTGPIVKWNPLAEWSLSQVWQYIRDNQVPYNPLHDRGFISIGCEPCTRAVRPGEHERAGRWWWEEATQRECGLHVRSTAVDS